MKTKRRVTRLKTNDAVKHVDVEVFYSKGGMNYFNGTNESRGYYLSVQPVEVKGDFVTMTAFSGTKWLIEEATRFSEKKLEELAAKALSLPQFLQLRDHVLTKNNLTLAAA